MTSKREVIEARLRDAAREGSGWPNDAALERYIARAVDETIAALAVFEQAHTPTEWRNEPQVQEMFGALAWIMLDDEIGSRARELVGEQIAARVTPTDDERTPEFEWLEQELFKHQPVLSMSDGHIAGCQCMDRVFDERTEDWGTHLAEVFTALRRPVQGEPTDAQIEAARLAYQEACEADYDAEDCIAFALRAAAAVTEQGGENR